MGPVTTIQQRLEALRALSHEAPSAERWERAWSLLCGWPSQEDLQVGLDYASAALEHWPDALRQPPEGALAQALERGQLPHAWPLVRHLEVGRDDPVLGERGHLGVEPLQALGRLGAWAPLRALHLRGHSLSNEGALALAQAGALAGLRHFSFRNQGCGPEGLEALVGSQDAAQLESLDMSMNTLWDEGGQILADAAHLGALRHLHLFYTDLGSEGLRHLARAAFFPQLESLDLAGNPLEEETLSVLASIRGLKWLGLVDLDIQFTPMGMRTLAHGLNLRWLERLELGYTVLTLREFQAWRGADFGASLRRLLLRSVELSPRALETLLQALARAPMRTLGLDQNRLGEEHMRLLAQGPWTDLEELDLGDTHLESPALRALLSSSAMDKLRSLHLSQNRLDAQAIPALLELMERGALRHLDLRYNPLGDEGALALAQDPRCAGLESLELGLNNLSEAGWRALRGSPYTGGVLRSAS